jgi:hypothetical protein
MLKYYEDLKPGDYVIQNAANSGVGRAVIQLARSRDFWKGFESICLGAMVPLLIETRFFGDFFGDLTKR